MEEGAWRQGGHRAACLDSRASAKVKTMLSLMFVKKHELRRRKLVVEEDFVGQHQAKEAAAAGVG